MRIATWNVNSLKQRMPRLLPWLDEREPDVVCLQETKLEDAKFPRRELEDAGYASQASGQKTYNGVAILTRGELVVTDVSTGIAGFDDEQKRVIAATVNGVRVICAYVPNGQSVDSDKYAYKLRWCEAAAGYLHGELARHRELAFCGDLNIAPEPRDVHDPALWEGQVLFSPREREAFARWIALGLKDSFRLFEQPPKTFSWWDYRMLGFPKNKGLRIDHILVTNDLVPRLTKVWVDRQERKGKQPSDHAPVFVELA